MPANWLRIAVIRWKKNSAIRQLLSFLAGDTGSRSREPQPPASRARSERRSRACWSLADHLVGATRKIGVMKLPVMPPVAPMLAKSVPTIPPGASYEPKWDGFQHHLPGRRRGRVRQPQREADDAVFPRTGRGGAGRTARALRRGRRDRHRHRRRARLRGAAAAHPPGGVAGDDAVGDDAGVVHRLRPAGPGRRGLHRAAVLAAAAALERALAGAGPPIHLTPTTTDLEVAIAGSWSSRARASTG